MSISRHFPFFPFLFVGRAASSAGAVLTLLCFSFIDKPNTAELINDAKSAAQHQFCLPNCRNFSVMQQLWGVSKKHQFLSLSAFTIFKVSFQTVCVVVETMEPMEVLAV